MILLEIQRCRHRQAGSASWRHAQSVQQAVGSAAIASRDHPRLARAVDFKILGHISSVETIAVEHEIRELRRLRRVYGQGRWRKRKGIARVELDDGSVRLVELHWYEAHGIGAREFKIKKYLD